MFSPVFAASSWRSSSIVFESCFSALTWVWSSSATSLAHLLSWPCDDFLDHVVGLAFFARLLFEDPLFGLALLRRDLLGGDVARRGRRDVQGDLVGEDLEVLVAGDEVGLALDFDHRPDLVVGVDVGGDDALLGAAPFALGGRGLPLDPQQLDRALGVALGLGQGGFAVHHRGPGAVPERLHVGSGNAHFESSFSAVSELAAAGASAAFGSAAAAGASAAFSAGAGAAERIGFGRSGSCRGWRG